MWRLARALKESEVMYFAMMQALIRIAESGCLPDALVRLGIRRLLRQRLAEVRRREADGCSSQTLVEHLRAQPIAVAQDRANRQHYEVPAEFFRVMLGSRMKYSSCHWSSTTRTLDEAEEQMLNLTVRRAGIANGMRVLDLGCGWGSLSLWIAERFPRCSVTAVSNSTSQARFIAERAAACELTNVTVLTADVADFEPALRFHRVVSVEMFEHMRNYEALLGRIAGWLADDGKLFVHLFCHRNLPYLYEVDGNNDWMARHFFTGGTMPSLDLLGRFDTDLRVTEQWVVEGWHYERTLLAWLRNLDDRRAEALSILGRHDSAREGRLRFTRWRLFLLGCAELFGFDAGREWLVAHYLLEPAAVTARMED